MSTMKKLHLAIEALEIESFETDGAAGRLGTVNGHQEDDGVTVFACGSGSPCYTNPDYTVTCFAANWTCDCIHTA
jgi:hypothetical protein